MANLFLNELLPHLVVVSLQASILAVVVILVRVLLGSALSPRWRYALWFLVLLRLAWPFSLPSPVSIFNLVLTPLSAIPLDSDLGWLAGNVPGVVIEWLRSPTARLLWVMGMALLVGRVVLGWLVLCWRLRGSQAVCSWPIWWLLQECKVATGVTTPLTILESPNLQSPCVVGFFSPRLVLPWGVVGRLSPDELRDVFLHELAHVKRRDIPAAWAVEVLKVLHWFNPLVWWICKRMDQDREEACDEMALDRLAPDHPKAYGSTLIKILEGVGYRSLPRMPGIARLIEGEQALVRRLQFILGFQHGNRTWVVGACACIAIVIVGFTDAPLNEIQARWKTSIQELDSETTPSRSSELAGSTSPVD